MVDKALFRKKAPKVMRDLMNDFDLNEIQAAGILGNIGEECAGFHILHETGQPEGKGGYGWCQWTADRRKSFLAWCNAKKLDWKSDEANYGYLHHELSGAYNKAIGAVEKASTLGGAVRAFEKRFEMAQVGKEHFDVRDTYGEIALDAYKA